MNCGCLADVVIDFGLRNAGFLLSPMKPEKIPDCSVCGRNLTPPEEPVSCSYETGVTPSRRLLLGTLALGSFASFGAPVVLVFARSGLRQPLALVAESASRLTKLTLEAGSAAAIGANVGVAAANAREPTISPRLNAFGN